MEIYQAKSKSYHLTRLDHQRFFYHKCLLLDYLASSPPFSGYGMQSMVSSVTAQMMGGTYLVALSENKVCGYVGWLMTTREIAESWLNGTGKLTTTSNKPSAAAITILAVSDKELLLPMVRSARRRIGDHPIFWKRHMKGRGLDARRLKNT